MPGNMAADVLLRNASNGSRKPAISVTNARASGERPSISMRAFCMFSTVGSNAASFTAFNALPTP